MLFHEFGNADAPVVVLLHGGGLSWWSLQPVIDLLTPAYRVVAPVIDGCGEDARSVFQSIEASAHNLMQYIREKHSGRVYALGGLSIGAQIVTHALSVQPDAAMFAVIESALVFPMRAVKTLVLPMTSMSYGLTKRRWFAKLQAKTLCVPDAMFERYYAETVQLSKQTLLNMVWSNGTYTLPSSIADTTAKTLVIVGDRELAIMRKSAKALHERIPSSTLYVAPRMKHGELSLLHARQYAELLQTHFAQ